MLSCAPCWARFAGPPWPCRSGKLTSTVLRRVHDPPLLPGCVPNVLSSLLLPFSPIVQVWAPVQNARTVALCAPSSGMHVRSTTLLCGVVLVCRRELPMRRLEWGTAAVFGPPPEDYPHPPPILHACMHWRGISMGRLRHTAIPAARFDRLWPLLPKPGQGAFVLFVVWCWPVVA